MLNKKLNENVKEELPTREYAEIYELEITEQDLKDGDIKKSIFLVISEIKRAPKEYGIDKEDISDCYIGQHFYFCDYEFVNEESYSGVLFLPVIDENKVIAIISVTNNTMSSGCTAGIDFAPALMKCLESSEANKFALITIDGSLYIVDEYNKWYQVFYRVGSKVVQFNRTE